MPFPAQFMTTPTGFGGQTLPDWISALQRLQEGRVSDPSADKMYAVDPRYELSLDPGIRGEVQAVPFGDVADPVSQLAFVLAPYLRGALGTLGRGVTQPSAQTLRGVLAGERGSTSGNESLEALKRMHAERFGEEALTRPDISSGMTPAEMARNIPIVHGQVRERLLRHLLDDFRAVPQAYVDNPSLMASIPREQLVKELLEQKLMYAVENHGLHVEKGAVLDNLLRGGFAGNMDDAALANARLNSFMHGVRQENR